MKLTTLLILIGFLQVNAAVYGQRININASNISIETLFKQIEKQSGYSFFYKANTLKNLPKIDVEIDNATIDEVLEKCFKNKPLDYLIVDKSIVVKRKEIPAMVVLQDNVIISGKVVDETGHPLPGVSVRLKNAPNVWITNQQGQFTGLLINPGDNAVLQISYVGYITQEIPVKNFKQGITITMKPDIGQLDEIQVIGYGQTTKRFNTGDQTTITAKQIENYPVSNVLSVLQGTVPGMVISQSTGQAGSTYSVLIRGQNGLITNTDPLYVVDGVPYNGGAFSSQKSNVLGSANRAYDALSLINPLDIESVNVLKDADATAIYGSRGANGVILITTKKGKSGDTRVDVNVFSGFSEVPKLTPLLNTPQYLELRREGKKNDNLPIGPGDYDINGTWDTTRYTNYPKLFLGDQGHTTNAQVSISGGAPNISYRVSGNFRRQSNVQQLIGGREQVSSLSFNLNSSSSNKRFNMTFSGGYTNSDNNIPTADLSGSAFSMAPNSPALYKPDGSLNFENNTFSNPLLGSKLIARTALTNLTSSMQASYLIIKGLTLQTTVGYNKQGNNEFLATTLASFTPALIAAGAKGSANYTYANKSYWSIEPQVNYNRTDGKGQLGVTIGGSLQKQMSDATQLIANGYTNDLLINNLASGTSVVPNGPGYNALTYKYAAYFGRANYNWDNKYILNISGRYDGSSRFGQDRQFHTFYAAGGAWLFSSEQFIKRAAPFISFGKLKASYGETGNDQIGDYLYLQNFTTVTAANAYQGVPGINPSNLANPYLTWETTRKTNFGAEIQFLNGRIGIDGNYFINKTINILSSVPLSSTTGFTAINQNLNARVQNKGFDITLNTVNVRSNSFTWTTTFIFSRQRNALLSFPNANTAIQQQLNQSVNTIFVNRYAGVNPQTGVYQFYDRNGAIVAAPAANGSDQVKLLNTNPDYFGSVTNTFTYKDFSLNFLFRGIKQLGQSPFGQIVQATYPGFANYNVPVQLLDRWRKPGDVATYERATSSFSAALLAKLSVNRNLDAFYSDASYIRLQNASLGYQFPVELTTKMHLRSLKVYMLGENLATISKYKFSDPEIQNYQRLSPLRTITFGIQASL
ncbi:SusC/RagA family TonB-linked outer membrane protein [Mucilaginibacter celer]|nr:SusC/RagA family TonB-linked outer membrane protein [Mucilaginibacter celer]